jgi:hypothetical protein
MPRGGSRPGTGGARPGAGRKPKSSSPPKAYIGAEGLPLDLMLAIMRDSEADLRVRLRMAEAAAPYCHRRMSPQPFDEDQPELPLGPPVGKKEAELAAAHSPDATTAMGALLAKRARMH